MWAQKWNRIWARKKAAPFLAPPSHRLFKMMTFSLYLILRPCRQLHVDLLQDAPALKLLLIGGGALAAEEALHRLAQFLQLLLK